MNLVRGNVYLAQLDPPHGTEPGKTRPVLILQTDYLNPHYSSAIICPFTSRVKREKLPFRTHVQAGQAGLTQNSDIMIDQLRAIDNRRFRKMIGKLPLGLLREVEEKVKNILDLP